MSLLYDSSSTSSILHVAAVFCCVVLEFRRRGFSQKLMSPLGISSVHAGRTSPGFTYHRLPSTDYSASPTFSPAGELITAHSTPRPLHWLKTGSQANSAFHPVWTGNEILPKCDDALQLGIKGSITHSTCE